MGKKPILIGNWDRPNCFISVKRDASGRPVLFEGTYGNAFARAEFHVRFQEIGEYRMRGRISLRSATDSTRVLRDTDGRPLAKDIRSKQDDPETIKAKIVEAFEALYSKYLDVIYHDLGTSRLDDLSLSAAIKLKSQSYFLLERRIVEHNIPSRVRAMERVALKLEGYRMSQIPQSALRRAHRELGYSADTAINDICLFIDYLSRKWLFHGENAFARYLKDNPKSRRKSTEELIASADRELSLTDEATDELDGIIGTAPPEEQKVTGILLVWRCGVNPEALFGDLTWGDVRFKFDEAAGMITCEIRVWANKTSSATCNYTRPTTAWAALKMKRSYDALRAVDPELDGKRIMEGVSRKEFTSFCRTTLLHCKESYEKVREARTHSSGGGVNLLRSDFKYRLMQYCGFWRSSELDYMLMHAIRNDVTMDHYSSQSSPSGQARLQLLLNRDERYAMLPPSTDISIRSEEGPKGRETTISVPPNHPALTTKLKCRLHLHAGDSITGLAPGGLTVRTILKDPDEDKGAEMVTVA